jgi:hypothetical protein
LKRGLVLMIVLVAVFAIGAIASAADGALTIDGAKEQVVVESASDAIWQAREYAIIKGDKVPDAKTKWIDLWGKTIDISKVIPKTEAAGLAAKTQVKVYVKLKTDDFSTNTSIVVLGRPAAPDKTTVKYDGAQNKILDTTTSLEYKVGLSDWITATATATDVSFATKGAKVQIRVKANAGVPAGVALNVTVPAAPKAPTVKYDPKIDGVKLKAGQEWAKTVSGNIDTPTLVTAATDVLRADLDADLKIYIRTAATEKAPVGAWQTITFPAAVAAPAAPVIDYTTEKLTTPAPADVAKYEYTDDTNVTSATKWTALKEDISKLIPKDTASVDLTLLVRLKAVPAKGTDPAEPASATVGLTVLKRAAAPAITVDYIAGNLGTPAAAGTYSIAVGTAAAENKTAAASVIAIDETWYGKTLKIKTVATSVLPASAEATVVVKARPSAPSVSFKADDRSIGPVNATMEYKIGGGSYTAVTSETVISDTTIGAAAVDVTVRLKATSAAPASAEKVIAVPVR